MYKIIKNKTSLNQMKIFAVQNSFTEKSDINLVTDSLKKTLKFLIFIEINM